MDFCKEFNARSVDYVVGTPLPTSITINPDRSFTFKIKSPATSYLLKKAAGIEKGAVAPGTKGQVKVGKVSLKQVYEIALLKQKDEHMVQQPLYGICAGIIGTARSMGIDVVY